MASDANMVNSGRSGSRMRAALALASLMAVLVVAPQAGGGVPRPAFPGDFPDPHILFSEGVYQANATNPLDGQVGGGVPHIQHMSSPDLVHWSSVHDAVPRLPAWASPGATWAPEVLRRGSQYVLYYAVHHRVLNLQCVSAATASTAAGPFADNSTGPFLCQTALGGSIDPSPFVAANGRVYLQWEAAARAGGPAAIYAQELRSDGHALVGARVRLIIADQAWEDGTVEGPALVKGPAGYYLFYSANNWKTANYAIGYAICATPLGGCAKVTTAGPWVSSNQFMAGPGGQSFFRDRAGALRMAYHAWSPGKVGYEAGGVRSLWIGHVGFDRTGRPVLTI